MAARASEARTMAASAEDAGFATDAPFEQQFTQPGEGGQHGFAETCAEGDHLIRAD